MWSATVVLRQRGTLDELATAAGIFPTLAEGMEGTARGLLRRMAPELVRGPLAGRSSRGLLDLALDRHADTVAPLGP